MTNTNLIKAKDAKDDEFYTRYADIANELKHYERHFAGKVVYCNCDDPAKSNFVKYFRANRDRLGLRGLLTNHLRPDGTGSFMSKEAVAKLAQADIVCTNPPFSLFRQFITQLVDTGKTPLLPTPPCDKKFLIIGNLPAMRLTDVFPLVKAGRVWAGVNNRFGFMRPDGTTQKLGSVMWMTNLEHGQARPLVLAREYDPALHLPYDNYPAINVDKIVDIPRDYVGEMGVPITILTEYDTSGFDIIKILRPVLNGADGYDRVIIKRLDKPPIKS